MSKRGKGDFRKRGNNQLPWRRLVDVQQPFFSLETSVQAQQSWGRRKESENSRLFFLGTQSTYRPPPADVGQTKLGLPAQYKHYRQVQGHRSSGQNLFLSSQRSVSRELKRKAQRCPTPTVPYGHNQQTHWHHGDTGTPNLNIMGHRRPHKQRHHGERHSHNHKVIGTSHTHIPICTHHRTVKTTHSHAPNTNITIHTHTWGKESEISQLRHPTLSSTV